MILWGARRDCSWVFVRVEKSKIFGNLILVKQKIIMTRLVVFWQLIVSAKLKEGTNKQMEKDGLSPMNRRREGRKERRNGGKEGGREGGSEGARERERREGRKEARKAGRKEGRKVGGKE